MTIKKLVLIAAATLLTASPALAVDDTLTIGFTVSRTGKLNNDSIAQMRGFELWRDELNDKGGISVGGKQYKINFMSYDDESVNARVQQLYTRLINQDKAQFLFSPYSSGLVASAAIVSEQYGRIMLTTGAAEEKTYKLGNKNLFQVYSSADRYLVGAIETVKELNPNARVALVYKDDPFSKAVLQSARKQAVEAGLRTVLDEAYSPETTDFGPVINKIISAKADVLLGGGHYPDGATLARQIYDHKAGLKWLTLLVAPDSPNFATMGDAAIGVTVPSQWEPQVSFKPDFGPVAATSRNDSTPNMGSSRVTTRRAAIRRASSCSAPSSRRARPSRPRSPQCSTAWMPQRCSAVPNSRPTPRSTACKWAMRWASPNGRRRAALCSKK